MLAALRLAHRLRTANLTVPLTRANLTPAPPMACSGAVLLQVAQCSGQGKRGRPPRGKVQLCEGGDQASGKRPKSKNRGAEGCKDEKEQSPDCCDSAKGVQDTCSKPKTDVCHESQEKFAKDKANQEEECESSERESDKECSSEEEDAKAPTKECSDEEDDTSSCSDDDEKRGKPASEMCDCVKTAVAKAVEQKAKGGGKPPQQKSLGKPGPCTTLEKEPSKPKASEHVRCCNVEKGKSESGGGKSAGEKCREERMALDRARSSSQSGGKESTSDTQKGATKEDKKNQPCACIKQALEKCKKGAHAPKPTTVKQPDKKKPDKKQPDSTIKKPSDKPDVKKPDKNCDDKKSGKHDKRKPDDNCDDKKHGKPEKNKPDHKKPAPKSKHCEKKKKPVVKCK